MNGEVKLECAEDPASLPPVIVVSPQSPVSHDAVQPSTSKRQRSARAARKRLMPLSGELHDRGFIPLRDGGVANDDVHFTMSRVVEVKPDVSPPRQKRCGRPRKTVKVRLFRACTKRWKQTELN